MYLHFDSVHLFEALLYREMSAYLQNWLEARFARSGAPLSWLLKETRPACMGKYLSRPGNILQPTHNLPVWPEMLKALQAVGAIPSEVQPIVMGYLMNTLASGIVALAEEKPGGEDLIEKLLRCSTGC